MQPDLLTTDKKPCFARIIQQENRPKRRNVRINLNLQIEGYFAKD